MEPGGQGQLPSGQTAKVRSDYRVQSLHRGTWPPFAPSKVIVAIRRTSFYPIADTCRSASFKIAPGLKTARIREKRWGKQKGCAVSVVTVNRALSTLRLIYNYAERCGFQVSSPVKHVEFFRETGRERIISFQEERAYLAVASQPLKDIARIMLDTGMRPEEVFRIERMNVDLGQRTIMNPIGKTKAVRRKLTMTEEVRSIMKTRTGASDSVYIFPSPDDPERPIGSVRKAHDGAVRRANVEPAFRLYDLRHTYASRAVMAGVDLPTLGALLGHTTIQMTMGYVHPAEEHKKEAAKKFENFKALSVIKLAVGAQRVPTISTTVR